MANGSSKSHVKREWGASVCWFKADCCPIQSQSKLKSNLLIENGLVVWSKSVSGNTTKIGLPEGSPKNFVEDHSDGICGGEGGIRTLEARFSELAPLAGVCLQPLGHFSALLSLHSNKNTHFIRLFIIFQVYLRESYWFSHPIRLQ